MNYWLTFKLNLQVWYYKYQNQICLLPRIMSSESNLIKLHLPTIQSDWNIDRYQSLWRHLPYNKFKKINRASRNFYYFVFLGLYYVKYNQYMQKPTKQDKMQTLFWTVLLVHHHSWLSNPAKFIKLVQIWLIDMIVYFKSTTINHRSLQVLMGVWLPTTLGTLFEGNPHAIKCRGIQGI